MTSDDMLMKLTLGCIYEVSVKSGGKHKCIFIMTTRKGFNFLRFDNSKCLVTSKHLYDKSYLHKEISNKTNNFTVTLPTWIERVEKSQASADQVKCKLCRGTGKNLSGLQMKVNNTLCPRCSGNGIIPESAANSNKATTQDRLYAQLNGLLEKGVLQ